MLCPLIPQVFINEVELSSLVWEDQRDWVQNVLLVKRFIFIDSNENSDKIDHCFMLFISFLLIDIKLLVFKNVVILLELVLFSLSHHFTLKLHLFLLNFFLIGSFSTRIQNMGWRSKSVSIFTFLVGLSDEIT